MSIDPSVLIGQLNRLTIRQEVLMTMLKGLYVLIADKQRDWRQFVTANQEATINSLEALHQPPEFLDAMKFEAENIFQAIFESLLNLEKSDAARSGPNPPQA